MIGHQRPPEYGPAISLLHKSKKIDEFPRLFRVGKYSLSAREAVVHVVQTTLDKYPGPSRHIRPPTPNLPLLRNYGPGTIPIEWNGLKFAYSSDTFPNKWWMEHAKGVDLAIHEAFIAPESLVEKQGFTPEAALNVGTQIHTSPAQFGKVMAETNPRMAVAYHFFNDFDTSPQVLRDIRRTYDGPLALAVDYMVFNVTKDVIKVRMAAIDEDIWPQPSNIPLVPPDIKLQRTVLSDYMKSGRVVHRELLEEIYAEINEQFGSNAKVP